MKITWYGGTTFAFENKGSKLIVNPEKDDKGANVKVYSTEQKDLNPEELLSFDWPGEYEAGGVGFIGVPVSHEGKEEIIYNFDIENIKICHLGNLDHDMDEENFEKLGEIDVLLVPLGENDTIDVSKAVKLTEKVEPRIVIPMLYNPAQLEEFKKEFSAGAVETQKSVDLKRSSLPTEDMDVVVLEKTA